MTKASRPIFLEMFGARGEGLTSVIKRLGLGGATPDMSDAQAMAAFAQYIIDNFDGTDLAEILAAAAIAQEYGSIFSTPFDTIASAAPGSPTEGLKYLNTSDGKAYIYTDGNWVAYTPKEAQWAWVIDQKRAYKSLSGAWKKQFARQVRVSEFALPADAFTFAGTAGAKVSIDEDVTLAANLSMPEGVRGLLGDGGHIILGAFDLTFTGQTIRADGETLFEATGVGAVKGTITGNICADWWGTDSEDDGDSATSDAANAAVAYVMQSENPNASIHFFKPDYYLSETIVKASSFNCPSFYGHGADLHYDFNAAAAFQIIGGSGAAYRWAFEGFTFNGSSTSWGLEIQGQGAGKLSRLRFETNAFGLVLHNKDGGQFTEFDTWEDCTFAAACLQAWWFKKSAGEQSFHGTGPVGNVTIEQASPAVGSAVVGDPDVFVYNAPAELQWFCFDDSVPLFDFGAGARMFLKGTVTVENFSDGTPVLGGGDASYQILVGSTMSWGTDISLGKLTLMDTMGINISGTVSGFTKRRSLRGAFAGTSVAINLHEWAATDAIANILVSGPDYISRQTVKLWADFGGHNGATTLGTDQNTYNGHGAPTYAWDADTLTISNSAFGSDYTYSVSYLDMDGRP